MKSITWVIAILILTIPLSAFASDLDLKVMGFCAVARFTTAIQDLHSCAKLAQICDLGNTIEHLDHGLSRSFAFVKDLQQIQLHQRGTYKGRTDKSTGPETYVFVTEPIAAIKGGILVFVSTTAPSRVAVFSLYPDMTAELVYDSYNSASYVDERHHSQRQDAIEGIGAVKVDERGVLTFTEFSARIVSGESRVFEIEYKAGRAFLRLIGKSNVNFAK